MRTGLGLYPGSIRLLLRFLALVGVCFFFVLSFFLFIKRNGQTRRICESKSSA